MGPDDIQTIEANINVFLLKKKNAINSCPRKSMIAQ